MSKLVCRYEVNSSRTRELTLATLPRLNLYEALGGVRRESVELLRESVCRGGILLGPRLGGCG